MPTDIYFDEVSSTSIVTSGYVATPDFTGLETGSDGTSVGTWSGVSELLLESPERAAEEKSTRLKP